MQSGDILYYNFSKNIMVAQCICVEYKKGKSMVVNEALKVLLSVLLRITVSQSL